MAPEVARPRARPPGAILEPRIAVASGHGSRVTPFVQFLEGAVVAVELTALNIYLLCILLNRLRAAGERDASAVARDGGRARLKQFRLNQDDW